MPYEGVDTAGLSLDELCVKAATIPQGPQLLRENLGPFGEYDDAVLNSSLRASGSHLIQRETDEGRITPLVGREWRW